MPDWCRSLLRVHGPKENVQEFAASAKGVDEQGEEQAIFFSKIVPEPKNLFDLDDGNIALIQWRVENWGTKWDPYAELVEERAGENKPDVWVCLYELRTPYSAPEAFVKKAAEASACMMTLAWFNEQKMLVNADAYDARGTKFFTLTSRVPRAAASSMQDSLEEIFGVLHCERVIQWTRDYGEMMAEDEEDD